MGVSQWLLRSTLSGCILIQVLILQVFLCEDILLPEKNYVKHLCKTLIYDMIIFN